MLLRFERRGLRISGGFFLVLAWFALENGWKMILLILSAAVVHELGHYVVLRAVGGRAVTLGIGPMGANLRTDCYRLSYGREMLAILAGPAVNLLAGLALAAGGKYTGWETLYEAAGAHMMAGCFNLLPIRNLDGGRLVQLALHWRLGPAADERILGAISGASALMLGGTLLTAILRSGGSLWLIPPAAAMLSSGAAEWIRLVSEWGSGRERQRRRG